MSQRRRRPILGAAVLVGASRSAARHEVQKQAVMDSQREVEIQHEVEARRRQEVEQERRRSDEESSHRQPKSSTERPCDCATTSAAGLQYPTSDANSNTGQGALDDDARTTLHTSYERCAQPSAGAAHASPFSAGAGILVRVSITGWEAKECTRHQFHSAGSRVKRSVLYPMRLCLPIQ
ncbi:uncharacterized protein B0I36DRAFT_60971 [Microdochium trichocladiopsis]|uniref:Uncharacterized protein n=1 Tax=Microdochium trichocladiopsis TaxID=1682393 RepID=A0A9P9BEY2_9PEZI|nr:uncharacterized protein B0I36DRAFT_60971 [Microdochium trichocladiopsis]KAH7009280.1 hypothetical protein B0I36DRAFT_60971 [Microdochium trichocladiopsis]